MSVFIGDVHGKYKQYKTLIHEVPRTIQVGDMGIGFRNWPHGNMQANPPYDEMVASGARFIRGNHDNPGVCRNHTQWIPDGLVQDDMMFVGGAYSIDAKYRIEEFSWWRDEELSAAEFDQIGGVYAAARPTIMVTHDCPLAVVAVMHSHHLFENSRTQVALQRLWEHYKPKLWVYGHHHIHFDQVIEGTRFVCLAELEMRELHAR